MDRRSLIKNAGLAGVLAAGVAPAVHAQAAVRWRQLPEIAGHHFRQCRNAVENGQGHVGWQI